MLARSNYLENPWLRPLAFRGCSLLSGSDMQEAQSKVRQVKVGGSATSKVATTSTLLGLILDEAAGSEAC